MTGMIGGVSYVMLGVSDVERSVAFYVDTLGRQVKFRTDSLAFIDAGPISIGLNAGLGKNRTPIAGAMEIVFAVNSVNAAWRALTAKGVVFLREPRQATDKDWIVTFTDPDGHYLTLFGAP